MRRPRLVGCGSRSVHSLGQQLADVHQKRPAIGAAATCGGGTNGM